MFLVHVCDFADTMLRVVQLNLISFDLLIYSLWRLVLDECLFCETQ